MDDKALRSDELTRDILEALYNARLGIADKTPDTPVAFEGFDVWEQVHTIALVQNLLSLITERETMAVDDYIEVTLGWMEPNRKNLSVDETIATLKAQLKQGTEANKESGEV